VIVTSRLISHSKRNNRTWFAALTLLSCFVGVSGVAAYADPNFSQVAGGTSSDTPALTFLKGVPIMMARANDSTDAMWYSINRGNWTRVPTGTTKAAPALVTAGSNVFAFQTGEDGNFYYMPMSNASAASSNWAFNGSWLVVPGTAGHLQTGLRPSIAFVPAVNNLYLFGTYADQSIQFSVGEPTPNGTLAWDNIFSAIPGNGFTGSSVSAAVSTGNILNVFQTGTDHNLYVRSADLNRAVWVGSGWSQLSGLLAPGALAFGTAASTIDSSGDIAVCGVDANVLRIACSPVSVKLDPSGTQVSYEIVNQFPSTLSVPGVPVIAHSPTMAFNSGSAMAIAATFSNPSNAQPGVWLSAVKSFPAIATIGQ
jgi:hypothetical protein